MRIVAEADALDVLRMQGAVYVWPRAIRCCGGRRYLLEASTEQPDRPFECVDATDGFQVFATPGLLEPDALHLELDRKGRVRAYWNNQGWIG